MNKIIIISIVFLVASIPSASAHKLLAVNPDNTIFQTATHIPDPFTNSYFTLEEFEREGQSHWYSFDGITGQEIFIQVLVPDISSTRSFTPSFDLIIGDDKVTGTVVKKQFIEEFSKTKWIITSELQFTLPADGLYYIRAHDELHHYSIGDIGKFSMSVGTVDKFTIFDWFQVPFWMLHVNLFFENTVYVWIMLVLLVIIGVIILTAIMKRRENQ